MAWTTLSFSFGSVLTSAKMTQMYDNFAGFANKDTGSPVLKNDYIINAMIATNAVNADSITVGGVGQSELAANSVGQSELKDTYGNVSTTSTSSVMLTLPGGTYGFYPQLYCSDPARTSQWAYGDISASYVTGSTPLTRMSLRLSLASGSAFGRQYYFTASPPYDLGDGEVGQFIFALIDNTTREVIALYNAPEAPWHYNGKTDIRGKLHSNGKKYRIIKDLSNMPFAYDSIKEDKGKLSEYYAALKESPSIREEITQDILQRDMVDIPHPFQGNDLSGKTIVLLDPVSDLNHEIASMHRSQPEFNLGKLIHEDYFKISNEALPRVTPHGIITAGFKWR